jgi:hypothetical protein
VEEGITKNWTMNYRTVSMESPRILVSVLQTSKRWEYDPQISSIVSGLARIKSVRQTERRLKVNYEILKSRTTRYKEIIPLCEQLLLLGIGFSELAAFHAAVMKRSGTENLPMSTAAYHVVEDIENYIKLYGMKEQLIKVGNQLFLVNEILGRKNNAINAMMKLQAYGVTDDEILTFLYNGERKHIAYSF